MTEIYKTPKVLHIQECDSDGNRRTVRYYREDMIWKFTTNVQMHLQEMQREADEPDSAGRKDNERH